jgi:hypothetical protein
MDCGYGVKEANHDNKALVAIQANDLYSERDKCSGTSATAGKWDRVFLDTCIETAYV